jgi:hypothetical protein
MTQQLSDRALELLLDGAFNIPHELRSRFLSEVLRELPTTDATNIAVEKAIASVSTRLQSHLRLGTQPPPFAPIGTKLAQLRSQLEATCGLGSSHK